MQTKNFHTGVLIQSSGTLMHYGWYSLNFERRCPLTNVNKALLSFLTAVLVKYDFVTQYFLLIGLAMLINEYQQEYQVKDSSKDAKFNVLQHLWTSLCCEQN